MHRSSSHVHVHAPGSEGTRNVRIPIDDGALEGDLQIPAQAQATVLFAHGSGSSRHSGRNRQVAGSLRRAGLGTLLFDLLTAEEEQADRFTRHLRFDIAMLTDRLMRATAWLRAEVGGRARVGYFGASTGAAAALRAAALAPDGVGAIVSRGGRADLAGELLPRVRAPTLLIVGGIDEVVLQLNREAYRELRAPKSLEIVPGASHLFEEPGTLEQVSALATRWFTERLSLPH